MPRNSNVLLAPTASACTDSISLVLLQPTNLKKLFAYCSVSWRQLTTAFGYACVSKVPVGFRNLQLVHDSCSAAKLVLRRNVRGGHFLLHHFDLAAFLTWRYTVSIISLLRLGLRFPNSSAMWVLLTRTPKTQGKD